MIFVIILIGAKEIALVNKLKFKVSTLFTRIMYDYKMNNCLELTYECSHNQLHFWNREKISEYIFNVTAWKIIGSN